MYITHPWVVALPRALHEDGKLCVSGDPFRCEIMSSDRVLQHASFSVIVMLTALTCNFLEEFYQVFNTFSSSSL